MYEEYKLSIVIPCYNEGLEIEENVGKVLDYLKTVPLSHEVILVDDGSKDDTLLKIQSLSKRYQNKVKALTLGKNRGKGMAVREGMKIAKGEYIFFMDADLSTKLHHIEEFSLFLKEYPVVIGSRKMPSSQIEKSQTPFRMFIGKIARLVTMSIVEMNYNDTQCGFKGFRRDAAEKILPLLTIERFCFDVEMLYVAQNILGMDILETAVVWKNREDSKVSPIKDGIKFTQDLIRIRKIHKKARRN